MFFPAQAKIRISNEFAYFFVHTVFLCVPDQNDIFRQACEAARYLSPANFFLDATFISIGSSASIQ